MTCVFKAVLSKFFVERRFLKKKHMREGDIKANNILKPLFFFFLFFFINDYNYYGIVLLNEVVKNF